MGCSAPRDWQDLKAEIRARYPSVPQMSADELAARLAEEGEVPLLVDVRQPAEFEVSHLDGAVNASGDDLVALVEAQPRGREVVLYCSVGYRSTAEAARLLELGLDSVHNLEGSIFEWANGGRPVFRDGMVVEEVHPFDDSWGLFLEESLRSYGSEAE